ncbi:hypothetical protein [Streptacidiphilus sp. EB103A]|uniref:hypothetical protein n=1 Tax=Streptacidiphilus sp. EB103A TaxID=3156275 RepID=UPI00351101A1
MRYQPLGRTGLRACEPGFGAFVPGSAYRACAQVGIDAVHAALDPGLNVLDASRYHGATTAETVLGQALHGIDRDSCPAGTRGSDIARPPLRFTVTTGGRATTAVGSANPTDARRPAPVRDQGWTNGRFKNHQLAGHA